ncbi:peptidylprolyl isomerase [Paraglaciecola polaris]|jgi:peptidyl-prolyl cis-trans isomerase A (cyclophilin A)|uniref:Peptidyl-prolyl cis-trans isomerase n=1 Tax=Paraglaciecola polaris LMG 21857 TaxID=1129793 RepID=K6YID9_9ALTE|nr:peptidylprolyl isomerase [Paraglaciecola polaris]GAC32494.1 peptidyl-prolyl cis-trans isomerase A [Paraglaciecola polaris LMG 21857]|tara:strand:+ start:6820 stop:7416 length:597 start_codon:yes stop_codon:yes gene_type:complete
MLRALFISIFLISAPVLAKQKDDGSQIQADNFYPRVKIVTSMGDVTLELDRSRAPIAVNNFLRYVDKRSYEDTIFHRVVADFIVQGGGYDVDFAEKPSFPDIINESGNGLKNEMYTVAMARQKDPHSSNRQFFFNMNDNVSLDPGRDWGYTVFGYVVEGTEVLDAISQVETDYDTTWGWADVPVEPVIIKRVSVLPPV